MTSPLLTILMQYAGAIVAGIVVGLLFKAYFASQTHNKIRGYQGDIVKSHAKILELEGLNTRLERRIKELEGSFKKDHIFMN